MSEKLRKLNYGPLLAIMVCLALTTAVWAQSTMDGGIGGTVVDPTKAVITSATVTVRNLETNESSSGTTDSAGGFRVIHLRPGLYQVTVNAGGFAPFKADKIIVEVGRITPLEVHLTVGAAAESVQVSGEAPVINTVQQDFTANINTTMVNDLPISMRRWSSFAMATPGAVPDGTYGMVSFRGLSGLLNNNTVDGGDNNNAYYSEERGRTRATATISQDAIREFQVNTSNFTAEYGRAAGAVVNAVTKSGTNRFHGTARLFATDSNLWAYNPFSYSMTNGVKTMLKPEDRRWQYGGNVGGPIKKDKLFFFFNFDQQREPAPGVAAPGPTFWTPDANGTAPIIIPATAPTTCNPKNQTIGQMLWCRGTVPSNWDATLNGGKGGWAYATTPVPAVPGLCLGLPGCNPAMAQKQVDDAIGFLEGLTGTVNRRKDQWAILPKIDWVISNKHTLTGTWNHMRWLSPGGIQTAGVVGRVDWGDDGVSVDTVNGRLVSLLSNSLTNEFRTSIGRELQYQTISSVHAGEPTTGLDGMSPEVAIYGNSSFTFGRPYYNQRAANPLEFRFQFADTLAFTKNNHLVKLGFDFNRSDDKISYLYREGGVYNYNYLQDWITDVAFAAGAPNALCNDNPSTKTSPVYLQQCFNYFGQGFGPKTYTFATNDYAAFIQDEWHATQRITLNLGLRWDYQQPPSTFWTNPALPQTGNVVKDHFDIGPRMGVAIDLFGNGKTVLRGGYGIYYARFVNMYIGTMLSNTGNFAVAQIDPGKLTPCPPAAITAGVSCTPTPTYPNILPTDMDTTTLAAKLKASPSVWGGNTRAPMIHEVDLVLEREIARNTVVSISYLQSIGRRLPLVVDANLAPSTKNSVFTYSGGPNDGQTIMFPLYSSRLNSTIQTLYQYNYIGKSRYDGLVFQINRRMTNGLQLIASYTHGRATDWNQHTGTGSSNDPLDPYHPEYEFGNSVFDIRHKFVFASVWQPEIHNSAILGAIVNGFSFAPTFNITSGKPMSLGVSGSASGYVSGGGGLFGSGGDSRWPLVGRNTFLGETMGGANMRVSRRIKITEGKRVELIAEIFNLSNHLFPTGYNTTLYKINTGNVLQYLPNGPVGAVTGGNDQERVGQYPRQWQFGARFEF